MKAMILAAGLGTRLKPLTDHKPKALVEVDGVPMLERVILTLKRQGFSYIVVNVHHFADQIKDYLASKDFGVDISISDESDVLLDTGGGIVKAAPLLFKYDEQPVLVHNVDILSNAGLGELMELNDNLTKLLVSERDSSRKLIFDENLNLKGWHDLKTDRYRPDNFINSPDFKEYAFSGIYLISKKSVDEMKLLLGEGKYSVMDYFLHPDRNEKIEGVFDSDLRLIDIGKPATLSQASGFI